MLPEKLCAAVATEAKEGPDCLYKATRLVVRKPVANALHLFDAKAWVKHLQFSRRFKVNNRVIPNDEEDWDG